MDEERISAQQPNGESKGTMQLVLSLKSRFLKEDFERTAMVLVSREEALEAEKSQMKEELEASRKKSALLEEENGNLKDRIVGLSDKIRKLDEKLTACEKGRLLKRKADSLDDSVAIDENDHEKATKSSSSSRGISANREISISGVIKSNTSLDSHSGDKTPQNRAEKSGKSEKSSSSNARSSFTKGAESEQSKDKQSCFSQNRELNWESEAEMINCLIEDPFLCMEAVCVLYRLEISQSNLGTKRPHGPKHRGLFGNDVLRCTKMAEFLARGDPFGPAKRSIDELNEHDKSGMKYCRKLIQMYSRHLFEVYKNKEDQYFC